MTGVQTCALPIFAERLNADLLLNITAIDGIYSEDPKKNPAAKKFSHLTPDGLIDIVSGGRMGAGANNIIDLVAAKMIQRSSLSMIVIDGTKPENIPDALIRGKFDGTLVSTDKKNLLPL